GDHEDLERQGKRYHRWHKYARHAVTVKPIVEATGLALRGLTLAEKAASVARGLEERDIPDHRAGKGHQGREPCMGGVVDALGGYGDHEKIHGFGQRDADRIDDSHQQHAYGAEGVQRDRDLVKKVAHGLEQVWKRFSQLVEPGVSQDENGGG